MNYHNVLIIGLIFISACGAKAERADEINSFYDRHVDKSQDAKSPAPHGAVAEGAGMSGTSGNVVLIQGRMPSPQFQAYIKAQDARDATKIDIQQKIADIFREKFPSFKRDILEFADDEGFVRGGIVFCNAESPTEPQLPDGYFPGTVRPIRNDGWGQNFVEKKVCTTWDVDTGTLTDRCVKGSFVDKLQRFLQTETFRITHQDICDAVIEHKACNLNHLGKMDTTKPAECIEFPNAFTTTLAKYASARYEHACDLDVPGSDDKAHFQQVQDCVNKNPQTCEDTGCQYVDRDGCWPKISFNNTPAKKNCKSVENDGDDEGSPWHVLNETARHVNALRRPTSYGLTQLGVSSTDFNYIVGCQQSALINHKNPWGADQYHWDLGEDHGTIQISKCGNLRSIITAINGNTQVEAYRQNSLDEAAAQWVRELEETKAYLVDFAGKLRDFREFTMDIWPEIEYEMIQQCVPNDKKYTRFQTGSRTHPLCYRKTNTLEKLNSQGKRGQSFDRARCFCRNGRLDGNDRTKFNTAELDELYLRTDITTKDCNNETMPISVYDYCTSSLHDSETFRDAMRATTIKESASMSRIYESETAKIHAKQEAIKEDILNTFPHGENFKDETCGRLVTANPNSKSIPDSQEPNDPKDYTNLYQVSNKGGNCLPFDKLYEVIFRLEFETGQQEMGEYQNPDHVDACFEATGEDAINACKIVQFKDYFCKATPFTTKSIGFRQLTYLWDQGESASSKFSPLADRTTVTEEDGGFDKLWFEKYDLPVKDQSFDYRYTKDLFLDGEATGNQRTFCHPDWIQQIGGNIVRVNSHGHEFLNPYELLRREVEEAVFNTEVAKASMTRTRSDLQRLWNFLEDQLTENDNGYIVSDIAKRAANHQMEIWKHDPDNEVPKFTLTLKNPHDEFTHVSIDGPWWPQGGPSATKNEDGDWEITFDPAPIKIMHYDWVLNGDEEKCHRRHEVDDGDRTDFLDCTSD